MLLHIKQDIMNLRFYLKVLSVGFLFSSLLLSSCGDDDPKPMTCDTTDVSFSGVILPIIEQNCFNGCHSGSTPASGFTLENYADVKAKVDDGRLGGAVERKDGFVAMPFNMNPLPSCEVDQILAWIDEGAMDN